MPKLDRSKLSRECRRNATYYEKRIRPPGFTRAEQRAFTVAVMGMTTATNEAGNPECYVSSEMSMVVTTNTGGP